MSEIEKKKRDTYRKNRSKLIMLQSVIIVILSLLILISAITYSYISKTYYVEYTESGRADYTVQLKDNEFYNSRFQAKDQTYVGTLVDSVIADMSYDMNVAAEDVWFDYSYSIMANLKIIDSRSDEAIFNNEYVLLPEKQYTHNASSRLSINELTVIDYDEYNELANKFVTAYDLTDTKNVLVVTLNVKVFSAGASVQSTTSNSHVTTLEIPLTNKTVDIEMTSGAATQDVKTIACDAGSGKEFFKVFAVILGVIDLVMIGILVAFILLTRTKDITYASKLGKIISHYKSYIQRILTPFDTAGYQILEVNSFDEMLEIRDTVQAPILMYENSDKTKTVFLIPTDAKLLYLYTLAVEGYDEPVAPAEEQSVPTEPVCEEPVAEPVIPVAMPSEPIMTEEPAEEEPQDFVYAVVEEPVIDEHVDAVTEEEAPVQIADEIENGIEVIGVVWPERPDHKIYRYDPNGETVDKGDVVLVPSFDAANNKDIIREAEVAEANKKVPVDSVVFPLKKIIRVVKRKAEEVFSTMILKDEDKTEQ